MTHMTLTSYQSIAVALETVLTEVRDTLRQLSEAAEAQHRALEANDIEALDRVLLRQEQLADRLAIVERKRATLMPAQSLREAITGLAPDVAAETSDLLREIAEAIVMLRLRIDRNRSLLQRSSELAGDTVRFLKRILSQDAGTYDGHGEGSGGSGSMALDRIA
jgi:hypothetical protein